MRKMENTRFVNKGIVKKDAKALLSGRPVYTDDIAPSDCLVVKLLRSPHAQAWIEDISTAAALKVPGIEAVFTYKDVPENRGRNDFRKYRRCYGSGTSNRLQSIRRKRSSGRFLSASSGKRIK